MREGLFLIKLLVKYLVLRLKAYYLCRETLGRLMLQTAIKPDTTLREARYTQEPALMMLRILMRKCRAKSRVEVFETCALLLHAPKEGAQEYADALLRVLGAALPKGPVIYAISAQERSFDESWLLALFAAISRADHPSISFLLRARLPLHLRRPVGWLAAELVVRMSAISDTRID